jgi:hypothetical protein
MLDASGTQHLLLAETLGLAMARRASDILQRHRLAQDSAGRDSAGRDSAGRDRAELAGEAAAAEDWERFELDNAVFTAVLDAVNECLGRFDARPADDRWCDALLQVIRLGQLAELASPGGTVPRAPRCPR